MRPALPGRHQHEVVVVGGVPVNDRSMMIAWLWKLRYLCDRGGCAARDVQRDRFIGAGKPFEVSINIRWV